MRIRQVPYHRGVIRSAHLRVYVPASSVTGLPPHRPDDGPPRVLQTRSFIWEEEGGDDAIYTMWRGSQYLCPRNVRLRMLEGMLACAKIHPEMRLLTDDERIGAVGELAAIRRSSSYARGHIIASAWHVPLRWFSAFHKDEREIYDRASGPSIRYRATLGDALDRVHWAASVLDAAGFADQVVDRVTDLERWLREFTADSMVELDYGEAARTFPDAELVFDDSAEDIRASLLALERGDMPRSGEAYERVARRWADPQSYTFSN